MADWHTPLGDLDPAFAAVGAGLLGILLLGSSISWVLAWRKPGSPVVANLRSRMRAWWAMVGVILLALVAGSNATTGLFALLSFLALREFATLSRTRHGDHHTLFWAFFVILPLQYVFVGIGWYGMFAIFIPVYAFLFTAIRSALAGDTERYLERNAKMQFGLMLCVYALSHLPAMLMLDLPGGGEHAGVRLLLWLLITVQLSDVFQYVWGKLLGRHKVLPKLSPNKTWEGLIGGVATAVGIATALWWLTPCDPLHAAGLALAAAGLGFCGGAVMSAIKRDAGLKDFGNLLAGHGGIIDRVDSLIFSAPVIFHVVRFYYTP